MDGVKKSKDFANFTPVSNISMPPFYSIFIKNPQWNHMFNKHVFRLAICMLTVMFEIVTLIVSFREVNTFTCMN